VRFRSGDESAGLSRIRVFDAADVTSGDHTREAHVSAGDYPKSGSAHRLPAIAESLISRPAGRTTGDELPGLTDIRITDGAVLLLKLRLEAHGNLWSAV
jgi:hypothetical protein